MKTYIVHVCVQGKKLCVTAAAAAAAADAYYEASAAASVQHRSLALFSIQPCSLLMLRFVCFQWSLNIRRACFSILRL